MRRRISRQGQILAAEDIALADLAALLGEKMAGRDIVDMDEVEAGIDESRHAARRRFDDHAAGRRRLHVAGPIGVEGLTITAGRPRVSTQLAHDLLGQEFRALIGADHVVERARRGLVGDGVPSPMMPSVATLLV